MTPNMSARLLLAALRFSPRQPVGLRVRFICPGSCAPPVRHFSAEAASSVPIARVKELRELTGAPLMDCKNALAASGSSVEKAVDWLRTKGIATASKKSSRAATQGVVAVAIGGVDGNVAALVEVCFSGPFLRICYLDQSLPLPPCFADSASGDVPPRLYEMRIQFLASRQWWSFDSEILTVVGKQDRYRARSGPLF